MAETLGLWTIYPRTLRPWIKDVIYGSGDGAEVVVKAGGPANHHLTREIAAHRRWSGPWLATGSTAPLLHADDEAHLLALEYLPGQLVGGHRAEEDPDTYRQAGALLAALHQQDARTSATHQAHGHHLIARCLPSPA